MVEKRPAVTSGINGLTMLHRVVFACVVCADVTTLGIQCATLDDVFGTVLVRLALCPFDYVVILNVAHLARDDPSKHTDQDRVTGVLVSPLVHDGVRLLAEPFPSCCCQPFF